MAEVATPSAIDMSLGTTNAEATPHVEAPEKPQKSRPEKPDEEKYKAELVKAEKEHAAAQDKLVCLLHLPSHLVHMHLRQPPTSTGGITAVFFKLIYMICAECHQGKTRPYEASRQGLSGS